MSQPLVSVCIPTYNGETYLQEALDSVLSQTYTPLEVIVSDDASGDATLAILTSFKEKAPFPVQVHAHLPSGIGANWNHCLQQARGKYIKFLFQDDVLSPDCILKMVEVMQQYPTVALVACKRTFIVEGIPSPEIDRWIEKYGNLQGAFEGDAPITFLDERLFSREDFLRSPMNKIGEPPTVLFKREVLREIGYFDETYKQILDYVFYYRLLKKHSIAILNQTLVQFRIHEKQATNVNRGNDIEDYEQYRALLYKEFRRLLHPSVKNKLALKYSLIAQIKKKISRVYRKLKN